MKKGKYFIIIILVLLGVVMLWYFHDVKINQERKYYDIWNIMLNKEYHIKSINKLVDYKNIAKINNKYYEFQGKYTNFWDILKEAKIKLSINGNMVPQGIAFYDNYILITAYDGDAVVNSRCYVFNLIGELINEIDLKTTSHVGSIAYDAINDFFWIPGEEGKLYVYKASDFIKKLEVIPTYVLTGFSKGLVNYEDKTKEQISYLYVYNDLIFVGSFAQKAKGKMKVYLIKNDDGKINLELLKEYVVPSLVQGVTIYEEANKKYLLLSRSFGRKNDSILEVYEYNDKLTFTKESRKIYYLLPPLLEQITVKNNELYGIFESNANKYSDTVDKIEDICVFDLQKIIDFE